MALLVVGLPALLLLLLARPDFWSKDSLGLGGDLDLSQIPEAQLLSRIHTVSREQEQVPARLIQLLGDSRPHVAEAARQAISRQLDHWRMLPRNTSADRVFRLARLLADTTPQMPATGRRHAAELAVRLLCWPLPDQVASSPLIDDCEQVLAAAGPPLAAAEENPVGTAENPVGRAESAAGVPATLGEPRLDDSLRQPASSDALQPSLDLPQEVRRWPSLPFRPLDGRVEQPSLVAGSRTADFPVAVSGLAEMPEKEMRDENLREEAMPQSEMPEVEVTAAAGSRAAGVSPRQSPQRGTDLEAGASPDQAELPSPPNGTLPPRRRSTVPELRR
jgi:hypothetical protein